MFYPEELIEEIREKNDIVDVIGAHVKLQRKVLSVLPQQRQEGTLQRKWPVKLQIQISMFCSKISCS